MMFFRHTTKDTRWSLNDRDISSLLLTILLTKVMTFQKMSAFKRRKNCEEEKILLKSDDIPKETSKVMTFRKKHQKWWHCKRNIKSDDIPKEMSSSWKRSWDGGESKGEQFLLSFHSLPRIHYNQPNSPLKWIKSRKKRGDGFQRRLKRFPMVRTHQQHTRSIQMQWIREI